MSGNKFIANEYVERIRDGAVGRVRGLYLMSDDTWIYGVRFGKTFVDEYQVYEEDKLRPHVHTHAHVSSQARDCDGTYLKDWTEVPTTEERTSEYGDLDFKNRVIAGVISLSGHGTLTVASESCSWHERTEEGYRHVEITWCDSDTCDRTSSQRDLTAESMGY